MIRGHFPFSSEWQEGKEEARQPAHDLRFADGTAFLVLDTRVRDLRRRDRVARVDEIGIDDTRKRMYSCPWPIATCFSPETSRLPLGSTSITVTVIVPVNTLLAAASPLPLATLLLLAFSSPLWNVLAGKPTNGPATALMLPVLLTAVFDLVAAEVFSVIVTVIVSPT
jgi:hypothetical protein